MMNNITDACVIPTGKIGRRRVTNLYPFHLYRIKIGDSQQRLLHDVNGIYPILEDLCDQFIPLQPVAQQQQS